MQWSLNILWQGSRLQEISAWTTSEHDRTGTTLQYNTNNTTNSSSSNIIHGSSVPEQHWSKITTFKSKLTMLPRKTWITEVCIQDLWHHNRNNGDSPDSGLGDAGSGWETGNLFGVAYSIHSLDPILRIVLCTRPFTSQQMTAHNVIAWEGKVWNVILITRDVYYMHDS